MVAQAGTLSTMTPKKVFSPADSEMSKPTPITITPGGHPTSIRLVDQSLQRKRSGTASPPQYHDSLPHRH